MKKGKRGVITITDNEIVTIPGKIRMSIAEIADLFGIYYQTAKRHIRAIEKSGIVRGDDSMGCVVEGRDIYPDYYGLDMVIVLAFRIQSKNAEVFRRWIQKKMQASDSKTQALSSSNYMCLN